MRLSDPTDPYRLRRFVDAQERAYATARAELEAGRKVGHWMWFVFPQPEGLGWSEMSRRYAIRSLGEAQAYLDHPVLGRRLLECVDLLLRFRDRSATDLLGEPDDLKLRSSMTLFSMAAGPESSYARVLDRFFGGESDPLTVEIVRRWTDD